MADGCISINISYLTTKPYANLPRYYEILHWESVFSEHPIQARCINFSAVWDRQVSNKGVKGLKGVHSSSWKPISELRSVTCHMGSVDHIVLPTTRHTWTHPALTPGRYTIYIPRMDRMLSWPWLLVIYTRWFICLQTVTQPGSNDLIATQPEVQLTTPTS